MKRQVMTKWIYCVGMMIWALIAACAPSSSVDPASAGSSTSVGNPNLYLVDASKVIYEPVNDGEMPIVAQSGFLLIDASIAPERLSIHIERNGSFDQDIEIEPSINTDGAWVYSFSNKVDAEVGDNISLVIDISGVGTTVLVGEASTVNSSPMELLSAGMAALAVRDITKAHKLFCETGYIGTDDAAKAGLPAQLSFGCFLSKLLRLPERDEMSAILSLLDEPSADLDRQLLGDTGLCAYFDQVDVASYWPLFNYGDFDLPLSNIFSLGTTFAERIAGLLQRSVNLGVDTATLQTAMVQLIPELEHMHSILESLFSSEEAYQMGFDFSFSIPYDLFRTAGDVHVSGNDVRLMLSAMKGIILTFHVIAGYDFGVEIQDSIADSQFSTSVFIEDLNGSGATVDGVATDRIPFLALFDEEELTSAYMQDFVIDGLVLAKAGLTELSGTTSEVFSHGFSRYDLAQLINVLDELFKATTEPTAMSAMGRSDLTLDLKTFFSSPPNALRMSQTDGNAFIIENDQIRPNDAYFRALLNGVATY